MEANTLKVRKIRVKIDGPEGGTAYIALPGHRPEPGIVDRSVSLDEIVDKYAGPRVQLDFNKLGLLIGIEILA